MGLLSFVSRMEVALDLLLKTDPEGRETLRGASDTAV